MTNEDIAKQLGVDQKEVLTKEEIEKLLTAVDVVTDDDKEIELTYIGEEILKPYSHTIYSLEPLNACCTETRYNTQQVMVPDGYHIVAIEYKYDSNEDKTNAYAYYENTEDVKVKVYKDKSGKKISPQFGTPIVKNVL